MDKNARFFASAILAVIAVILVAYTWAPARSSLRSETGTVSSVISLPNTWFEVEITTESGARLSCKTRRGWPLFGPQRCPLNRLEPLKGQAIIVVHDGRHPYEIKVGGAFVIEYAAHRSSQLLGMTLATLLLASAYWVLRRK